MKLTVEIRYFTMGEEIMKKRKPVRLYPEKEDITLKNFLLENKQLVVLIIIIVIFSMLIIGCLFAVDLFRAEHYYNYI